MFTAYATYTSYLTQFINWTEKELNEKPLFDVTWDKIRSYIRFLKNIRQPVLNLRTINVHIAQLRDFFQYVLHRDWDRYRVPYLHFDEHLPKIPTRKEITAVIDSLENRKHKAEIDLLYATGIRVSELCRLHCGDIHRVDRYIYISRSCVTNPFLLPNWFCNRFSWMWFCPEDVSGLFDVINIYLLELFDIFACEGLVFFINFGFAIVIHGSIV